MPDLNAPDFRTCYDTFINAGEALACISSFNVLKQRTGTDTSYDYETFKNTASPQLSYSQKRLFQLLDVKRASRKSDTKPARVVVSGAGPVGLRSAVELALLGHHCTLLELRDECSRHNILKTWTETMDDMYDLGFKVFFPFFQKGKTLHMGTRELQLALLKVSLLLGVDVHFGQGACGILKPQEANGRWSVWTLPNQEARAFLRRGAIEADVPEELALATSETDLSKFEKQYKCNFFERALSQNDAISDKCPVESQTVQQFEFDSLIVSEGESSRLIRNLGFDRKIFRLSLAIGMVVNLDFSPDAVNNPQAPERFIEEGRKGPRSTALDAYFEKGLRMEYLEYMQGSTHFLALSTRIPALVDIGVLKEKLPSARESLSAGNIDFEALRKLARALARSRGIPDTAPFSSKNGVQLFDYSCRGLCVDTHKWLSDEVYGTRALVLPAGDTFQNPYWPQGLGVNRGIHSGLDAVWAAHLLASGMEASEIDKEREFAFQQMEATNWLAGDRPQPGSKWTADPMTRYASSKIVKSFLDKAVVPNRYWTQE